MNLLYSRYTLKIKYKILMIFTFLFSILATSKIISILKKNKKLYLISSKISQIKEKVAPIGKSSIIQNSQLSVD